MTNWDPAQYLRHDTLRSRPLRDLLARVPELPGGDAPRIADLGCGPGGPTMLLAERWPRAHVTGYDNSAEMLAEADGCAGPTAGGGTVDFASADLATWRPAETYDLLLSNAALQWVLPAEGKGRLPGHEQSFPAWVAALPRGGVLAFQVPGNFTAPHHTLLHELRNAPRWRSRLGTQSRDAVLTPAGYFAELAPLGCEVDAWETTYLQVLQGEDAVLDWTKGTALRPVLTLLADDPDARDAFLAEYAAAVREAYPPGPHGTVFPFRRVFAVAVKR